MKKIIDIVFIMICLAFVVVPFLCMNRHEDVTSEIDNRKLVEAPTFGAEEFTVDYEEYLKDRIGFRDEVVNAYNVFNDKVFHELTHPIYTYGQNGYVFFNMHENNPFGDYPIAFADLVKKIQVYCESRGSHFYFIFDPEKISVYRNYLPRGVNYDDSWVDEMFQYMDKLGINYVNNTQLLMDRSKTEQVFNKVYDAGHWNDLGAFYATNALWERVHEDIPTVTPMDRSEFIISEAEETVLPVSDFKISEQVPCFELKQKLASETDEWLGEIELNPLFPGFSYEKDSAGHADNLPKLMTFQGSYFNRAPQFFESRASIYIAIQNYQNVLNLPYYYNIFKPDIVILDAAEYVFTDDYFDLAKAKRTKWNPALFTDGESFDDHVKVLTKDINRISPISFARIKLGRRIDTITLSSEYKNTKYAYLLINKEVFDLFQNNDERLNLSIEHGKVKSGDSGIVLIEDKNANKYWAPVIIQKGK